VSSLRLLFVPASGARGAGEYFRCLSIAQAARRRWPDCGVRFVVNRDAGYAHGSPYETTLVEGSPTFSTARVNQSIDEYRPHVVIFDSAGRVAQLAHAQRARAATVYISSRFKTRWKGFRLRRMRHLDQHWLAWPRFLAGDLTAWERLKVKVMGRPEVVFLDPVRPETDPQRAVQTLNLFGLSAGEYLFFSGGGGGYDAGGLSPAGIFGRAALDVHHATGRPVVWVRGPNYAGEGLNSTGIVQLDAVPPEQMMDLLANARLAVVNGGSLLLQALGTNTVTIAAPIAGDQPQRIAACVRLGLAVACRLRAEELSAAAVELLADTSRCDSMRDRMRQLALGNGAQQAVAAIGRLFAPRDVTGAVPGQQSG
jgi:hypothetical protein